MTRILRSVAKMRPSELWSRGTERVRTIGERIDCATGRPRWERERLRSRLSRSSVGVGEAERALADRDWRSAGEVFRRHFSSRRNSFPLDPGRHQLITASVLHQFPNAADEARVLADRLVEGRRQLLGYSDVPVGSCEQIDWHFDPVHNRRAPRRFWASIPYLDPQFGDHKVIWELNRHQHWLSLGRAAWLTGDPRYAHVFQRELAGWLADNPPLVGINWSSMLELGFRALSWIWSLHFFSAVESESGDNTWLVDMLVGLDEQLNHISRHLSTYFSPNTHLLGEGLALYVAGRCCRNSPLLPAGKQSAAKFFAMKRNVRCTRTAATPNSPPHYHRYALDFYLLALTISPPDRTIPTPASFAEVTSRMATFCGPSPVRRRSPADDRRRRRRVAVSNLRSPSRRRGGFALTGCCSSSAAGTGGHSIPPRKRSGCLAAIEAGCVGRLDLTLRNRICSARRVTRCCGRAGVM